MLANFALYAYSMAFQPLRITTDKFRKDVNPQGNPDLQKVKHILPQQKESHGSREMRCDLEIGNAL